MLCRMYIRHTDSSFHSKKTNNKNDFTKSKIIHKTDYDEKSKMIGTSELDEFDLKQLWNVQKKLEDKKAKTISDVDINS